jgi:hypothetical protein
MTMTTPLGWTDMALRLALTVLAGILLGYNRSEHGKAAGMRTTVEEAVTSPVRSNPAPRSLLENRVAQHRKVKTGSSNVVSAK